MLFKMKAIEGRTLEDTWFQLLFALWDYGRRTHVDSGSHAGEDRIEFDFAAGCVALPHIRPLAPSVPEGVPRPTTDEAIEAYFANYLMDPKCAPGEEYRYAQWINRKRSNIHHKPHSESPIEWVIRHFREAGHGNNHCYIGVGENDVNQFWSNFAYDKPYVNETERGTSPCLRGLDFKIKDGCLLLGIVYRSWDLYGGWPENMGGFTLLNEYVASNLEGVEPGPLFFSSMGLHCYSHQIEVVSKALNRRKPDEFGTTDPLNISRS